MKTAVNAPIPLPQFNLGSMNYILAHECLNSKQYLENNEPGNRRPVFTILDNGADELGTGLTGRSLFDLVGLLRPDELILPDVLQDWNATLEASEQFLLEFGDDLPEGLKLMGVCQGRTREEWLKSFYHWQKEPAVHTIGIPYDIDFGPSPFTYDRDLSIHKSVARADNRFNLVQYIIGLGLTRKPIHLLGMNNLAELSQYSDPGFRETFLRSTDTTAPFAAANAGRRWQNLQSGNKDWPPLDFSSGRFHLRHLIENLAAYFVACGDQEAVLNLVDLELPPGYRDVVLEYNSTPLRVGTVSASE